MKASLRHFACISVLWCGSVASGYAATYTVKPGDSLSKIARSHGCTVESLAKTNGIKLSAVIQAGQTLKLPGTAAASASGGGNHTIQPGDTFSSISRQYGVSVDSLLAANPGLNPKSLKPGQKISISASRQLAENKPEAQKEPTPVKTEFGPGNSAPSAVPQTPDAAPLISQTEKPNEPSSPAAPQANEDKIRTVMVDVEMTFGEFANQHGSDITRLNELNGLDLTAATVLAKGSELYVPAQATAGQQR